MCSEYGAAGFALDSILECVKKRNCRQTNSRMSAISFGVILKKDGKGFINRAISSFFCYVINLGNKCRDIVKQKIWNLPIESSSAQQFCKAKFNY